MNHVSQNLSIIRHLSQGKSLTPLGAFKRWGCLRLSGRIFELRSAGWPIETQTVAVGHGQRVAKYFIPGAKR